MPLQVDPITPADPAGYYADINDVYARGGRTNVEIYSDLDGLGMLDIQRAQKALDYADCEVDRRFRQSGIDRPVTTHANFPLCKEAASLLALLWLYDSRGMRDNDKKAKGKMDAHRKRVDEIMLNLCIPGRMAASVPTTPEPNHPTVEVI